MTLDADSDGWFFDTFSAGNAWTYGKEVWCNLEGRYMHIVADLSHLLLAPYSYSSYTMSIC